MEKGKNLCWIDIVKAICMIGVYLLHSEEYYGVGDVTYGYMLRPFYVNGFFFVSGYLVFKSYSRSYSWTTYKKDIANILYRIIIPTLIFSSIIYIPKAIFHNNEVYFQKYLYDVFGGLSFWFVSALAVSQLVLRTLLLFNRSMWFYLVTTAIIFVITTYYIDLYSAANTTLASYFPWFYKTGLVYTFIMLLGGMYCKYEKLLGQVKYSWMVVLAIYSYIIASTWNNGTMIVMGLSGRINEIGFIAIISGVLLIIEIAKRMPNLKWLTYIGRQSIIFYFFSGVMPAAYGKIACMIFPNKFYLITIVVAFVSVVSSYIITKIIYNYLPFLVDMRNLTICRTASKF